MLFCMKTLPWNVRIFRWAVRRYWPELARVVDEDNGCLLVSMRHMADKLNRLKAEKEEWRQRCFSAERVLNDELRTALREGCKRHNAEHGHSLRAFY